MTKEKFKFMEENRLYDRAMKFLINQGFPPDLKGTIYLAELIALGVAEAKYSIPPQSTFLSYFQYKYGINRKSYERRLWFACKGRKNAPNKNSSQIYEEGWYELHKQLGKEKIK